MTRQQLGGLAVFLGLLFSSTVQATLQVFPTRLVLSDTKKVTSISLRHLGSKTGSYHITAVFYRMKPDGNMELVEKPEQNERSLAPYVRFSPREVTLAPKAEQVVRVMYAGPGGLPEGEYRAHLHFEPTEASEDDPKLKSGSGKITIELQAKLAVAVPVLFRHGKLASTVVLSDAKVVPGADKKPLITTEMTSTGNSFPYGDFFAFFTPKGGKPKQVALVRGLAGYREKRQIQMQVADGESLSGGTLRVEFHEPEDAGGKLLHSVESELP